MSKQQLKETIERNQGKLLPGQFSNSVANVEIRKCQETWAEPTMECIGKIYHRVEHRVLDRVEEVFRDFPALKNECK